MILLAVNVCFLSGARITHLINFSNIVPIMLALCLMLLVTYYALNYAGIIGQCLATTLHDMCGPSNKHIRSLTLAVTVVVLK